MTILTRRRHLAVFTATVVTATLLLTSCSGANASTPAVRPTQSPSPSPFRLSAAATTAAFDALEKKYSADLGVYAVDIRTGRTIAYHSNERFAFASTYKALAAGVLFARSTDDELAATIHYDATDLVDYSPITGQHVETGMSLHDLVAAALQYSDNTAANLMLEHLGGPPGLHEALRRLGDNTTNVDRTEPDVNTAIPGDLRDTTTPHAIAVDLRAYLVGNALTPTRRAMMTQLMLGNTTGAPWIRAGLPSDWTIGDKTGSGGYGTRNDIAVAYRPDGDPVLISIMTDRNIVGAASDDTLIAEATQQIVTSLN
jgi:beta-lactamase class A